MESKEAFEHLEHMDHAARRGGSFARRAAVIVAILAALLAISTLLAEREAEHTVLDQAQSTDAWNEYQANSLKVHVNQSTATSLRVLAAGTPSEAAARSEAAKIDKSSAGKYEPNKTQLMAKAQSLEAARDESERRHKGLQLAQGAFQLGIVLTSVALLAQSVLLVISGAGLGIIGLVLLVLSFTPAYERLLGA
jgi:hypothetical protein